METTESVERYFLISPSNIQHVPWFPRQIITKNYFLQESLSTIS
jgi:hypothetical protein